MAPETDEQILQSFLSDDESLLWTEHVEAVQDGFTTTPPQMGDDVTVGVTEQRLLWFDDELAAVDRSAIDSVERDTVGHRSAPTIVRIGSLAMLAGLVAAVVSTAFAGQPLTVAAGLAIGGIAVFAATIALARIRGDASGDFEKHRLTVTHDDGLVLLWGSENGLSSLAAALDDQRSAAN